MQPRKTVGIRMRWRECSYNDTIERIISKQFHTNRRPLPLLHTRKPDTIEYKRWASRVSLTKRERIKDIRESAEINGKVIYHRNDAECQQKPEEDQQSGGGGQRPVAVTRRDEADTGWLPAPGCLLAGGPTVGIVSVPSAGPGTGAIRLLIRLRRLATRPSRSTGGD